MLTSPAVALNPSLDISQYAHTVWTLRDGFFPGYIEAMAQTRDGYLWLGTESGLVRFDGVRFVPWKSPAGERLPGSFITGLLAARDGSLWIGTRGGLARWKDGKLTDYPELAGHRVDALVEDRAGTVWSSAGWEDPASQLCAIESSRVQCYGNDGSLGKGVSSLYDDRDGKLWVAAETGLWRWRPGPPKLYPVRDSHGLIHSLIGDDNGTILIAMSRGVERLVDGKPESYPLPAVGRQLQPTSLLRDRNGGLWIGTLAQGLLHLHQGRMDRFTQANGLSSDTVSSIFEDHEGDIWVATLSGLDRFRDLAVTTISVKQGLSNDYVQSVLATRDGGVWLGTLNGLNRWKDGTVTIYRKHRTQAVSRVASTSVVREVIDNDLPRGGVQSLFQDSRGRVWVFTKDGLAYFEDGRFTPVRAAGDGSTLSVAGDNLENLWISNVNRGLLHLLRGKVVEALPWTKFGGRYATSLVFDPLGGGLWLGFAQGGVSYFKDGQVRKSYASVDGLGDGWVIGLQLDRDGTLWASTEGGLSRVKNGRVATLNDKNGLPCNTIRATVEDDSHALWMYTACGLVRIARAELDGWAAAVDKDPKRTVQITAFDNSDGAPSHLVHSGFTPLVAKSADGRLWFATFEGVRVIDPRQISFNPLPPPVHIEQVTADRITYEATSQLRLPSLVRDLQIDFTALSLVAPEKVRFRYRLEGRDRDWQDVGSRRQAFYTDLPPANYHFRVTASNNSGVWNQAGASWDFSTAPAYYQTNWFRLACAAVFAALLWCLYWLRLRRVALQFNMRLEERVGERTRIAGELHDTLLQSFQGLMLRFQTVVELLPGRPLEAKQALEVALERADEAIGEGRDAVHELRSSRLVGNDLVQAVTAIGEEFAANDASGHAAKFRMVVEGAPRTLRLILRDEIYQIGREALWNAFRHAQARLIEAEIAYSRSTLRLRIRDDGIGINPIVLDQGGRAGHWGLPGMRERAQRIGGRLDLWSRLGGGVEIELSIPGSIAYETSQP
ncbi:MAG TPA: two-component regulator propeller domain-containing protein [Terriglobia bacterium]|nr:two-component regulator propeller domain-containing protein [Terriglobia bacterium]